jgi:hypothetical protein
MRSKISWPFKVQIILHTENRNHQSNPIGGTNGSRLVKEDFLIEGNRGLTL